MANPFYHWKESDLALHNARVKGKSDSGSCTAAEHEGELHGQILAECQRRGWIPFHGSMAHRTFRTEGEPDFVILADGGRVLLIEGKASNGKLSPAQLAIHAWARKLGHTVYVVRRIEEFLQLCLGHA